MPDLVDPGALIEKKLRLLADEHEPRIDALVRAIETAGRRDVRALKAELRTARRAYASARGRLQSLRGPGIAW